MNMHRIKGILVQEFYITLRSYEVIVDIILSPILNLILFGFLTLYLTGNSGSTAAFSLLGGALLWNIVFIIQYSVSVGSLWNVWSHNLSNMFTTPISTLEYIGTYFLSGIIKSLIIFLILSAICMYCFNFNIFKVGFLPLIVYTINLALFAVSLGILLLGCVFRYGTRIQAFAWGILPVFQVLSASFYPVSVLPVPLQYVAKAIPSTYVFESFRVSLDSPNMIVWEYVGISFVLNILYLIVSCIGFNALFSQSKSTGQFAKLDG